MARLGSIAAAARQGHGRKIALVGRSMHKIVSAARETGYLKDFPAVLDEAEAAELPPHRGALSVHRQPGRTARSSRAHRRRQSSQCAAWARAIR